MDANDNFDDVADAAGNLSLGCHLVVFLDRRHNFKLE